MTPTASAMPIRGQGTTPDIPPMGNHKSKPCFDTRLYRERNPIERFFAVAIRDKLAASFLAIVQPVSMRLWLRAHAFRQEPRAAPAIAG